MTNPFVGATPALDGRPFRWSVGIRPIAAEQWLVTDASSEADLAIKDSLFESQHADVVVSLPKASQAGEELLARIIDHLHTHGKDRYLFDGPVITDVTTGRVVDTSAYQPIESCGRLVAEDFAILSPTSDDWALSAASICFPSRWNLQSKLGQNLSGIHKPVPGYEDRLGAAVRKTFERLDDTSVVCRTNWTLLDTNELHLPAAGPSAQASESETTSASACASGGDTTDKPKHAPANSSGPQGLNWVRTERQTLRKLPRTGAVVFTILTRVIPRADLDAAAREALASTLATVPGDIARYKGWV